MEREKPFRNGRCKNGRKDFPAPDLRCSGGRADAPRAPGESGKKLKEFVENPDVSVTVTEANSFKVYVSGQVRTPGVFKLRTETNLLQIISMAGGFTEWANPKKILIIRKANGTEKRIIANHKRMADGKELILVLKPGDTVIVP